MFISINTAATQAFAENYPKDFVFENKDFPIEKYKQLRSKYINWLAFGCQKHIYNTYYTKYQKFGPENNGDKFDAEIIINNIL